MWLTLIYISFFFVVILSISIILNIYLNKHMPPIIQSVSFNIVIFLLKIVLSYKFTRLLYWYSTGMMIYLFKHFIRLSMFIKLIYIFSIYIRWEKVIENSFYLFICDIYYIYHTERSYIKISNRGWKQYLIY